MPRPMVTVEGLAESLAAMDALTPGIKEQASITFEIGAAIMEAEATMRAPVAEVDGGTLKASLFTATRSDGLEFIVGSNDLKARWVEFATVDTPAQPFLWPGFRIGARYIRKQMRLWAEEAGEKIRLRTKRHKRPKAAA